MRILEVIEAKRWENTVTGSTASLYGSVPWANEVQKQQWHLVTVGYTWRTAFAEGCVMPDCYFKGRPVYIGDLELRGCDSMILEAHYADTDEPLTDDELYELQEQEADYLCEKNMEHYGYWPD